MIKVKDLDVHFKDEVMNEPGGENLLRCFSCGTCTASCPVREIDEKYNPRKIIRMTILGMKQEVLSSDFIWLCAGCYACQERCPQDVKITDLMNAIKNVAVKEGYIHPSFTTQIELLQSHGRLYEIGDFDNKKREKFGLPPIKENAQDVKAILSELGLDKYVASKQ